MIKYKYVVTWGAGFQQTEYSKTEALKLIAQLLNEETSVKVNRLVNDAKNAFETKPKPLILCECAAGNIFCVRKGPHCKNK